CASSAPAPRNQTILGVLTWPFRKGKTGLPSHLGAICHRPIRRVVMSEKSQESGMETGVVTGGPKILLRLEGLTLFAGMVLLYAIGGGSWWVFAILFLAPDLSFLAYLPDPKTGAIAYNAVHSYMAPVALLTAGFALAEPLTLSIAMIWLAHIGI